MNPTEVIDMPTDTQNERRQAYVDAIIANDWDKAFAIARLPIPYDATDDERHEWICRREFALMRARGITWRYA